MNLHRYLIRKNLAKDPWSFAFIVGILPFLGLVTFALLIAVMSGRLG